MIVVYTITDECDNEVTKTAVFTIVDETNPEVTCDPDDKEIECLGAQGNEQEADAWNAANILKLENCSSDVCGDIAVTSNYNYNNLDPDCGETGTLIVVYTITDECDNEVTKTAVFTIVDETNPEVTCDPDDKEIECLGAQGNEQAANAWNAANLQKLEDCSSDVCGDVTVTSNYSYNNLDPDCGETGTLIVVYTITDECDNEITKTAVFTIVDETNPVIDCPNSPIDLGCNPDLPSSQDAINQVTGEDICGEVTITAIPGSITDDCEKQQVFVVTVTDECGNSSSCEVTFTWIESQLEIICPGNKEISGCLTQTEINQEYQAWLDLVSTTGGCNPNIEDNSGDPPFACIGGSLTVTFTATDDCFFLY